MPTAKLYVGTSGWSYSHWAKGRFYARGLKSNEWLGFLAQHFATVEVNASYYRPPTPHMIERWRGQTPRAFRFAVKMWKRVTHQKRLVECGDELKSFLSVVGELGTKRGPLLVQLPPSLRCDVRRLAAFFADLRAAIGRRRWRVAVEFRHPSWLNQRVVDLLDDHGVALCLADLPKCPIIAPGSAAFVYVRRHGPGGSYRACYTRQQIADDASRVVEWLHEGRDVYVYYNNDIDGYAVDNARGLLARVSKGRTGGPRA